MNLLKRTTKAMLRPFYRKIMRPLLRPAAFKLKYFLLSEIYVQLGNFERRFPVEDAVNEQRFKLLDERLRRLEANVGNSAQWDALEQLILALFRVPDLRESDAERTYESSRGFDAIQVDANHLR